MATMHPGPPAPFRSMHDPQNTDSGDWGILVIGYRQQMEPVFQPRGIESYFLFLFPADSLVRTANGLERCPADCLFFQENWLPVEHRHPGNQLLLRSWMRFLNPQWPQRLAEHRLQLNTLYPVSEREHHEQFLLQLEQELSHPLGSRGDIIEPVMQHWLRDIQREQGLLPQSATTAVPVAVQRARRFINQHFFAELSLDSVVEHSGISRTHLCRSFKQHYGCTPMHYAMQLRLEQACELLRDPSLRLSHIAEHCSFNDEYYFSRCFKRHFGMPPGTWRQGKL